MENWQEITETTLKQLYYEQGLSDRSIAEKYGVTKGQVQYKRRKFGILLKNKIYEEFVSENSDLFTRLNRDSRERLLKKENIDESRKH